MLSNLLGRIIEKADFGCIFLTLDGNEDYSLAVVSDVNALFLKITGCCRDDLIGKRMSDLTCPFFSHELPAIVKDSLLEPVYFFIPDYGRGFHIESLISDGVLAMIVRDNSSLAAAYEALQHKQEQLRTLINATPDLICFKDSKGRWQEANESDLDIFSIKGVDYQGKTDSELSKYTLPIYAGSFEACEASDEITWRNGTVSREEEIIPLPDGTPRVFDVIKVPLYYDEEKTKRKGIVVLGRDITEKKKVEDEMNKQAGLINSLFNAIPDMVFLKSTEGKYMGCNKAFEDFIGKPVGEFMGKTDYDIFEPDVAEDFTANDRIMLAMGQSRQNNEWVEYADGRKRLMATIKSPHYGADGELKGILGISRDITELHKKSMELQNINANLHETIEKETDKNRKYEQILFNQKKLADIGNMVSAIAHHWRQPLNALGLYVQDIGQTYKDGTLNSAYVDEFENVCMQLICSLSATIDNFSDFFKPESSSTRFSVMREIRDILKIYEAKMSYLGISFSASCFCGANFMDCREPENGPLCSYSDVFIEGYRDEFKQGFINILQNAVDAVEEEYENSECSDKVISVDISLIDDRIEIRVFNNGKEIPAYVAERIFHPYFTTKGEGKGTGIGLYLTKNIIENYMNGKLFFENTESGVSFFINLPVKSG